MKALCWMGRTDVRVVDVPEPKIINPRDAIVKITRTAICGSDLHLYDGYVPAMMPGDILGHEFMGEVVEVGSEVKILKAGDRVVVPFPVSCGSCFFCLRGQFSLCDNTNPNAEAVEKIYGYSGAGLFGYSHLFGGYAGGQAEYARVPFADVGPIKVPEGMTDEQVLFLSDIFPTGYMGAEMCDIKPGDTVAVWGAGPVGQFAVASAYLLGAERVVAIDRFEYRLAIARKAGAETLNYEDVDVLEALREMTGGRGPDACIDAVGMEAHSAIPVVEAYDKANQLTKMENDRGHALREAILSVANAGTVSVVGVYSGYLDKFPMGSVMNRSITIKTGQCHVHRYLRPLLEQIRSGAIDPTFVITHRMRLSEAPQGYRIFRDKQDECNKIVLTP